MINRVVLSERLADLCHRTCSRCAPADGCAPFLLDEPADGPTTANGKLRITFPLPRCERCHFLLLMQAIERLIPPEAQTDWLAQPNADLGGLSPTDCIAAGTYEPVFMALFFLDPCGPVS